MKKGIVLALVLLIPYISASYIEVTSFIFDPQNPQSGETVTILVRLANKTYTEDVEVTCRLFIDGTLYDVKVVPVLHRSSSPVSFTWLAQSGSHVFSLELSSYIERTEYADTFVQYLTVPGTMQEEIDYYAKGMELFDSENYMQAKILFEQAKRVFEEDQNTEQALDCEKYIRACDQHIQAAQFLDQAGQAYEEEDFSTALTYYQQARSLYQLLNDEKASVCEEKIAEIEEIQRRQSGYPYYLLLLIPVITAIIAFYWLKTRKSPPPLPPYTPERRGRLREETKPEKRLFKEEDEEKSEITEELNRIESQLDTEDPQTFKSLVEDFKKQEILFEKKEHTTEEADTVQKDMKGVKEKLKEKGKRLQDVQRLKDLHKRVDILLNQPVDNLVETYNKYVQLQNVFSQIQELGTEEQEEVRGKLKEFFEFIQQQAKSEQS